MVSRRPPALRTLARGTLALRTLVCLTGACGTLSCLTAACGTLACLALARPARSSRIPAAAAMPVQRTASPAGGHQFPATHVPQTRRAGGTRRRSVRRCRSARRRRVALSRAGPGRRCTAKWAARPEARCSRKSAMAAPSRAMSDAHQRKQRVEQLWTDTVDRIEFLHPLEQPVLLAPVDDALRQDRSDARQRP